MIFNDRADAGRLLALRLLSYKGANNVVVLGLARGGVIVASEIAKSLNLPLNVVVVRKVGAPRNEELALGAVTEKGVGVFNNDLIAALGVSILYLQEETKKQQKLALARATLYRKNHPFPSLQNKIVVLVDDGIATGSSMRAALNMVKSEGAKKIIVAVPVAAADALRVFQREVDEVVCLSSPAFFESVGSFYKTFPQCTDEEIFQVLSG